MRLALTRRQRGALLTTSAVAYVLSSGLFGQSLLAQEREASSNTSLSVVRHVESPEVGAILRRDPFSGDPTHEAMTPASDATTLSAGNALASQASGGAWRVPDIAGLPPDPGLAPQPSPTTPLELRATIAGRRPLAYVQDGTSLDIVRIGSKLGERTIVAIGLRGIVFDDGTSLALSSHPATSPRPSQSRSNLASAIDEIRRLIRTALRAGNGAASAGSPSQQPPASVAPVSPAPDSRATLPPPGPLPTVVPDFLPVGVSPTSDPNGATPFPLPPLRPPY
jgi:hypothetical protein